MLLLIALSAATATPAPLAKCPVSLTPAYRASAGARLLGRVPAAGLSLSFASLTNDAPGDVDAEEWTLAEFPPDDSSTVAGVRTDRTAVDTTTDTVTIACSYGAYPGNPHPPAMLLIPIPPKSKAVCRFTIGARRPAAMTCTRGK